MWPIHPPSGYFMVLIDTSAQWPHICFLFARLPAQIIPLMIQFPNHPIKTIYLDNPINTIHLDNIGELSVSLEYDVEHPITHVDTQNGLVESLIKHL